MTEKGRRILAEALALSPVERAILMEDFTFAALRENGLVLGTFSS